MPLLVIISLAGSLIGANILVNIDPKILHSVVGIILIFLPLIFAKRDLGIQHKEVNRNKVLMGSAIYFFVQIFAAFFGGGTGTLAAYALMFFFGLTILEATATKIIPWFFSFDTLIDMSIGGYLGAYIALKKGDAWVKRLFFIFVIISAGKLLFF